MNNDFVQKVLHVCSLTTSADTFAEHCWLYVRGQTPGESEENFLKIVAKLDTYGVDPHCVKVILYGFLYSLFFFWLVFPGLSYWQL